MPNPKLETYKNKATGTVYDLTDADAQSKVSATVDLMKDTTGWTGKNRFNYKNAVNATNVVSAVDMTSGDISIKDVTAQWSSTYIGYLDIENGKTYKLVADKVATYGRFGFSTSASLYPQSGSYPDDMITFSGTSPQTAVKILFNGDISITAKASGRIYLWFCSDENYQTSHQAYTIKIMIEDTDVYALSPTYEPYHESVAEMLTLKHLTSTEVNNLFASDADITNANGIVSKYGHIVIGRFQFKLAKTTVDTPITIVNMPDYLKPYDDANFITSDTGSGATSERHDFYIHQNGVGEIVLRNSHSADRWIMVNFTYVTP